MLIGIAAATVASSLYSLGIAVQAVDARQAGDEYTLRLSLLTHLLTRGRWLAGTAMTASGWPLQIVALWFAPLEVVQPALASGLLVLLLMGERLLGERPGRRELLAVGAIIAGVAGIAALAPPRSTHHVHGIALVLVLALLAFAALLPYLAQLLGRAMAATRLELELTLDRAVAREANLPATTSLVVTSPAPLASASHI